jgi:UPF0271 protein
MAGGDVRLNIDLGELAGEPEALYASAQIANIACGGHAGDEASMQEAVERCLRHGTAVGAHPSYPDRENFGRREISLSLDAIAASVAAQCARLADVARALGAPVQFVKAHGALYHAADRDAAIAGAVTDGALAGLAVRAHEITLIGPAAGALAGAAERSGMVFAREAFADRGVRPDGTLVPRGEPGAVVTDPARVGARAAELCARGDVDTLCVHGDTPGAVDLARAARSAIDAARGP